MGAFRKFVFVICFIVCIVSLLGLLVFSVFASYKGGGDTFPSLYGAVITNGSGNGLFDGFMNYLFNSIDMIEKDLEFFALLIIVLFLIVFLLSPAMIIAAIILCSIYFAKRIKNLVVGNKFLAIAVVLIISSQLLHFFLFCFRVNQIYFLNIRLICLIASIALPLLMTEISSKAKYELKISIYNKISKIITLILAVYVITNIYLICTSNSFYWNALFSIFAIELVAYILFEALFVNLTTNRYGIAIALVNALIVSLLAIAKQIITNGNVIDLAIILVQPFAFWIILSTGFEYNYNKLAAQYGKIISDKMSGYEDCREVQPQIKYQTGINKYAFIYFAKIVLGGLIVTFSMIIINCVVYYILNSIIYMSEKWSSLISNVASFAMAGYAIYLVYNKLCDPDKYFKDGWSFKNSTSCAIFTNIMFLIIAIMSAIPLLMFDFSWSLMVTESRLTYAFVAIIIYAIVGTVYVNIEMHNETCVQCHYLISYKNISSWKGKSRLQRHTRRVDGHYVTDRSTSTTTYNTSTSGSSDIHVQGHGQVGFTLDKGTSTTSATTNTTTQRWVDGYEVDEGLYEHQTRYTQKRCVCCGFTFTSSSESSHLVG